jgi:hypothetical protein
MIPAADDLTQALPFPPCLRRTALTAVGGKIAPSGGLTTRQSRATWARVEHRRSPLNGPNKSARPTSGENNCSGKQRREARLRVSRPERALTLRFESRANAEPTAAVNEAPPLGESDGARFHFKG